MRAVIEKDALQESFSGAMSDIFIAAHSAVLGVTPAIIKEYLSVTDGVGMYKEWFDKTFTNKSNYSLVVPESLVKYKLDPACMASNYLGAAFHNSGPLIAKSSVPYISLTPVSWGVSVIDAHAYTLSPAANVAGSRVAEIISLVPAGNKKPELLKRFLLKENKIFIFDKTINLAGADFICELTRFCDSKCKIVVMSNFHNALKRGLLTRVELEKHLNAGKRNGTIEVLQADRITIDNYHDRFIFLGDRFQLTFSSGMDCFGRSPAWVNSDGDVTVHCVYSSDLKASFKSGSKIYVFKSKGV